MIFLANFELSTSYYMEDKEKCKTLSRLIEADSEKEAKIKLYKEYKVDYGDYEDESKSFSFPYDYCSCNSFNWVDISSVIK